MNLFINGILNWIKNHPLMALLIVIAVMLLIYHFMSVAGLQGLLRREQETRSQEHQERIEEDKTAVNQSANLVNEAKANTQRIENANFSNTSLRNANSLRCAAFPERCK